MTPEEFRRYGRQVVDWVAAYLQRVEELPVLSQVRPGDVRAQLPRQAPVNGRSLEAMLGELDEILLPGITHWQSPNFFGYYPATSSGPSILGELLAAGLGVQGMMWSTSPACTELETLVLDWLVDMLGLPARFQSDAAGGGVIQDSASSATLCALVAARERHGGFTTGRRGIDRPLVAYASTEAHSSIDKAMMIAGLGADRLRRIKTDAARALDVAALRQALAADRQAGCEPFFVMATVGTTAVGAIDPVGAIGPVCRAEGLWLHVDAAMAGTAALCPEHRYLHDGLEYADSYCFNPHKWMFVNFDCDCFYVADRAALTRALRVSPEYLQNAASDSGRVIDYRDWQIPLGRRFRALKLWLVIGYYGVEGLRALVRRHVAWARELAGWIDGHPDFELAAAVPLNLVCFRHRRGDAATRQILERVNRSGRMFLTHARLDDRLALRMCIGQIRTEHRHVRQAWQLLCATAADVG